MITALISHSEIDTDAGECPASNVTQLDDNHSDTPVVTTTSRGNPGPDAEGSWASLVRDAVAAYAALREAAASIGTMVRRVQEAMARAQRQWESVTRFIRDGFIWAQGLPARASSYCGPYSVELGRRGLPPLSPEEAQDFLLLACLICRPEELGPGERVPLAEVALAGGRLDVAAAIWGEQLLEGGGKRRFASFYRQWEDWQGEAFVGLRGSVLPSVHRRLQETALAEMPEIAGRVASQRYLVKSLRNHLSRRLKRETGCRDREMPTVFAEEMMAGLEAEGWEGYAAQQALTAFLDRDATDLDRRIAETWCEHPDWSARKVAQHLGVAERTVRYRRERMRRLLTPQLMN